MAGRRKKAKRERKLSERQIAAGKALQLTWELKGRLKSFQMYYLRIGAMLARVRDEKVFSVLDDVIQNAMAVTKAGDAFGNPA